VFIVVYFIIDSVLKLLDTPLNMVWYLIKEEYVFMAWCLVKQRDTFFYFTLDPTILNISLSSHISTIDHRKFGPAFTKNLLEMSAMDPYPQLTLRGRPNQIM
jgi:hypothetical protein